MPPIEKIQAALTQKMPAYLDIFRQMVEINSFSTNTQGVNQLAEYTAGVFASLGFKAEFVPSADPTFGNHLFMTRAATHGPASMQPGTIALVAHLDTVFSAEEETLNDFHWRIQGERVYGPGTVDIKGGTVMMWMVLEMLQEFFPALFSSVNWLLAWDASEEVLGEDFNQQLLARLPKDSLACLVFEGGTPNPQGYPLVVARKGRGSYRIQVEGRSAHAGNYHAQGANAIVQLAHTVLQLADITDYERQLTVNVGKISGGTVVNRVPHHAQAKVEMRVFSPQVFQEAHQRILALDGTSTVSSQDGYPCKVSVQAGRLSSPWPRNTQTDALFATWQGAASQLGIQVIPEQRGGLSDGNMLWQHVPTLDGLGPSGANAHCSERSIDGTKDQEYAELPSFIPKALINTLAIAELIAHKATG